MTKGFTPASMFDADSPFFSFCASMPLSKEGQHKIPTINEWPTEVNFKPEPTE